MVIVEAELGVLIFEAMRYATQGASCLSWFEVLPYVLEVVASKLLANIFATEYRWLRQSRNTLQAASSGTIYSEISCKLLRVDRKVDKSDPIAWEQSRKYSKY